MNLNLAGVGDTPDCGTDPCTWWDDIYMRDACIAYRQCVNPSDPMATLASEGLIVGGAQVVGQTTGAAIGTGVDATITGIAQNPITGQTNWGTIALMVAGIMVLPELLRR